MIYSYATHGMLTACGSRREHDKTGRPRDVTLYSIGQVREAAETMQTRRKKRREKRTATSGNEQRVGGGHPPRESFPWGILHAQHRQKRRKRARAPPVLAPAPSPEDQLIDAHVSHLRLPPVPDTRLRCGICDPDGQSSWSW